MRITKNKEENVMVRIKDIAKTCGVSTATVSYVIHGKHEKVSKEVRERIEAEIAETGYITNQSAINLVSRCSGLIGVAVMNTSEKKDIMGDPYFSILFSYLEKEFRKRDKYILIILDQSPEKVVKDALRWNLDGLILSNYTKENMIAISREFVKPIVTIDAAFIHEYDKMVQVFIDDYLGGYKIGQYFASINHINVAMLDDNDEEETRHRWRGFRQAFLDNGINIDEDSHFIINIKTEELQEGLDRFYPKLMEKTAVFCNSDFYALRLIKYLNEHGKKVPDDISVAGYDDIFFSKISSPELTTIRQDVQMKAEMAVDSMMRMIKNKPVEHNIKLPVELIVRQSCKSL